MKSQAERGQWNNILRAGLHAKIQQQTDFQNFLGSWSSIAFVKSVEITGGHSIFWNSPGTISTFKLLWHVFLPVLFLSGFYSSIDFNGLQLRSLVSESLELYLYGAQTTRSLVSFFSPSDSSKHYFLHWSIILIGLNLETFRYLSNHMQFHCCLMTLSLWIYCDNWQLHLIACHPTLMF